MFVNGGDSHLRISSSNPSEAGRQARLRNLFPVPQQHQHEPVHHAGGEAEDQHRPGDDEHLRRHARDEALCLSQVKHKNDQYLVDNFPETSLVNAKA